MPYVNVPNDLSKVKTKMALNLTKRQLICFPRKWRLSFEPMPGTKWPISGGSPGIRRSILWTAMTGSNIPPACMSQRPRSFWSAWSCSSVCGTHSTLCRRARAAGLMPTSFLERASRKLPRPRAYMRSLSASRSSVALSA